MSVLPASPAAPPVGWTSLLMAGVRLETWMKLFGKWLGALVMGWVVSCGPMTEEELEALELAGGEPGEMQSVAGQVEDVLNSVAPDDVQMEAMEACPAAYTCPSEYSYSCEAPQANIACTGTLSACFNSTACRSCELGPNGKPYCWYSGTQTRAYQYRYWWCSNFAGQRCRNIAVDFSNVCGCNEL